MTTERDVLRALDLWLEDGPNEVNDLVLDRVERRIAGTVQRPGWLLDRRFPQMSSSFKLAATVAAILVVGVVGWQLLPASVGPSATPSPQVTTTPTPTIPSTPAPVRPTEPATACGSNVATCLAAGTYSSEVLRPKVTFTVPSGQSGQLWGIRDDRAIGFQLVPPGDEFGLDIAGLPAIPEQAQPCVAKFKEGGNAVADWVDFLTTQPGLIAGEPIPVTVGGYEGFSVRFAVDPSWTGRCGTGKLPAVITLAVDGCPECGVTYVDTDQAMTYWIVDVAGRTVIVQVYSGADPPPTRRTSPQRSRSSIRSCSLRRTPPGPKPRRGRPQDRRRVPPPRRRFDSPARGSRDGPVRSRSPQRAP